MMSNILVKHLVDIGRCGMSANETTLYLSHNS